MSLLFDATGLSALPEIHDDPLPTLAHDDVVPVNWNHLSPDEAHAAWTDLNAWVTWLRKAFGLPPTIVPPLWHRHDELVWELSALHTHWLACYDPDASPSAPIAWMRDFADARHRLRDWVAACGTRLDRDRPTRTTMWPGEPPEPVAGDQAITDRDADFAAFVDDDVASRRRLTHEPGGAS
ncbi:hypothetical protein ET495_10175 [Xylanimonas allomyrinae]|uniref:DUF4913 domain-containing protein n=2 Tax=Xylanimonas allomyrinae TaxID=2509459 RepID=A0A4P6EQQ2_9MICO|nr:hypothetical protein ET495_10175 [Xylanimonas allomyrinae]